MKLEQATIRFIVSVWVRGQKHMEARVLELPDGKEVLNRSRPLDSLSGHVFSLDPRALRYALDHHPEITEIHLEDASGNLYSVPVDVFAEKAVPINFDGWPRLHLPEEFWKHQPSYYEAGFNHEIRHVIAS